MLKNIIITGIGGQGVVTAAGLLRWAALAAGFRLSGADNRGGAQRLGHVSAIIRLTDEADRPMAPEIPDRECDLLISLEATEGLRFAPTIGPQTVIVYSRRIVIPTNQRRARLPYLNLAECERHYKTCSNHVISADYDRIAKIRFGKTVLANLLTLGIGVREAMPAGIREVLLQKLDNASLEAFRAGLSGQCEDSP